MQLDPVVANPAQRLARAIMRLKHWSRNPPKVAVQAARGLFFTYASDEEALARLGLASPATLRDRLYRALMACALQEERPG